MTTFDHTESSRDKGLPVALYLFPYGDNPANYYGYTNAEEDIVDGSFTYRSIPITQGEITVSGTLDKDNVPIMLPGNLPLLAQFGDVYSSVPVNVQIRVAHDDGVTDEYKLIWAGKVTGIQRSGSQATLNCTPASQALQKVRAARRYQKRCGYALYDPSTCKADKAARTSTQNVVAVNGPLVTVHAGWNAHGTPAQYGGGIVSWVALDGRTERRTLIKADDTDPNTLLLSAEATTLVGGMTVSIAPGCNHYMDDCLNLHQNIKNHGGQPLIPIDNPFGLKNIFY